MCKLHNEVFKAVESHINTECVCPSQEGMNLSNNNQQCVLPRLPLARGDESSADTGEEKIRLFATRKRG